MINNRCLVIETHRYRDVGKQIEPSCPNHDNPSLPYGRLYYYIPESPEKRKGTRHSRGNCSNTDKGVYSYPEEYRFAGKTRPTKYVEHRIKQTTTNGRKPLERIRVEERKGSQRVQCEGCRTKFSIKLDPQMKKG